MPAQPGRRGGDLRRVVRAPLRPRRGCGSCTPSPRRHRAPSPSGARRAARDQPVHVLAPRAQARRGRLPRSSTRWAPRTMVSVNQSCCTGLPHAADVVMGDAGRRGRAAPTDLPADVTVRAPMPDDDLAGRPADLRRGHRHPQRHLRDRGPRPPRSSDARGCPTTAGSPRSTARSSAGRPSADLRPRLLRRRRRVLGLRRRGAPRPRRGQGADAPPGHRGRRRRPVDPADLDLPREPGQHRPAPLRRLPHPRRPRTHRPTPRHLARHRLPRFLERRCATDLD